jgi:5-methyltetrahydrofolate--homocysteine methyltransferase
MIMSASVRELLARRAPIIYDGATGTLLQQMGLPLRHAPESWVLEQPAQIYAAAEAYVNAGSQIILTCTFGGTAIRLLEAGLDSQAYEINRRAAQLAKQAAGNRAFVAGSMGPLGQLPLAFGAITRQDAVEQFSEQARALVEGGVDLIAIESMSDLQEISAAIEGVRRITDLPIFATMSFDTNGRTLLGVTPTLVTRELLGKGVEAMGANCGHGPEDVAGIIREMRSNARNAMLIAKPNAGIPQARPEGIVYPNDPEHFALFAREWVRAGANIIGGCCGTTPKHMAVLKEALMPRPSTPSRQQIIE